MEANEAILSSIAEELTYLTFEDKSSSNLTPYLKFKSNTNKSSFMIYIYDEYVYIYYMSGQSRHSLYESKKISLFETKNLVKDIDDFIRSHIRFT